MNLTLWFIIIMVGLTLAYDGIIAVTRGIDATVSRQLLKLGQQWPIVPFLLGVVAGHLFWTNCG
jgi:hypothetical protein